jgi:hypothetical protein
LTSKEIGRFQRDEGNSPKLVYDGFLLRTTNVNEIVSLMFAVDKDFSDFKNEQGGEISTLSECVIRIGLIYINI